MCEGPRNTKIALTIPLCYVRMNGQVNSTIYNERCIRWHKITEYDAKTTAHIKHYSDNINPNVTHLLEVTTDDKLKMIKT